jgi:hypothetical protein
VTRPHIVVALIRQFTREEWKERIEPQITQIDADLGDEQEIHVVTGEAMAVHGEFRLAGSNSSGLSSLLIGANLRNLWLKKAMIIGWDAPIYEII